MMSLEEQQQQQQHHRRQRQQQQQQQQTQQQQSSCSSSALDAESALPLLQELSDLPCTSVQQKLNRYVSFFSLFIVVY